MMERVLLIILCLLTMHPVWAGIRVLDLHVLQSPLAVKNADELLVPIKIPVGEFHVIWLMQDFSSIKVTLENDNGIQNIRSRDFYLRRRVVLTHETCNPCRLRISVWTEHSSKATIQIKRQFFHSDNNRLIAEEQLRKIQLTIDAPENNEYSTLWHQLNTLSEMWNSADEKSELINSYHLLAHFTDGKEPASALVLKSTLLAASRSDVLRSNLQQPLRLLFQDYQHDPLLELLENYKNDPLLVLLKEQRTLSRLQMNVFALARIHIDLGREEFSKGHYLLAKYYYNKSLALIDILPVGAHKTLYLLASAQHELGQVENKLDQYSLANSLLNSAFSNFKKISEASSMADVLNTLGFMNRLQNKLAEASAQHQVALQLSAYGTDAVGLDMRTLYYIGVINVLRGHYFTALETLREAEAIAIQLGVNHWHAHIIAAKARVNLELGQLDEAHTLYFEALSLYALVGAQADFPTVYTNLGRLFAREGNIKDSVYYFEKAKASSPELTGQEHKLNLAQAEITALMAQGNYTEAYDAQTKLLIRGEQSANEFFQGRNLSQLADIAIHQGNFALALEHALLAIDLHRSKGDDLYYIKSNYLAALSSFKLHKSTADVISYLDKALASIEVIRSSLLSDDIRREYFSLQRSLYDLKVRAYLASQAPDAPTDALLSAESFRARTLYETFLNEKSTIPFAPTIELTVAQSLNRVLAVGDQGIKKIATSLQFFNEEGLRKYQQKLTEKEAVLYYFLSENVAYVWVIQSKNLVVYKIETGKSFSNLLKQVLADLNHPPYRGMTPEELREQYQRRLSLSRVLLGRVGEQLQEFNELTIIPDGHLHQLAFVTLLDPSRKIPLLNTHTIAYSLSLATDAWLRHSLVSLNQSGAMLVVANSGSFSNGNSLPAVITEITTVKSLWGGQKNRTVTALVDRDATKANIAELEISRYEIMHFAGHAKVNWDSPALTAILLASDEHDHSAPLTASEIIRWKLNSELVVLNACETAQGRLVDGEGSMGLSRAFFEAGAKRVVASLWPVEDSSSAYFMEQFYQSLFQHNKSPLYALQEAQQAVSRVPRWSHPYYWSGMAYFGKREAWRE